MRRFEPGEAPTGGASDVRQGFPTAAPRYEVRECWRCSDGRIYEAVGPTEGPRLASCPSCGGTGKRSVYLYPNKGRRS